MAKKNSEKAYEARQCLKGSMESTTYGEAFAARPEGVVFSGVIGAAVSVGASEVAWRIAAPEMVGTPEHIACDIGAGVAGAALGSWLGLYAAKCGMDEVKAQVFHNFLKESGLSDSKIISVLEDDDLENPKAKLLSLAAKATAVNARKKAKKGDKKRRRV